MSQETALPSGQGCDQNSCSSMRVAGEGGRGEDTHRCLDSGQLGVCRVRDRKVWVEGCGRTYGNGVREV